MFNKIKNDKENRFFSVSNNKIIRAENEMGIIIPDALKEFYTEVGYGFLKTKEYNANRIMDPGSLVEFRNAEGDFSLSEMAVVLKEHSLDKLVFFEANESSYISIGISGNNRGMIYYFDDVIAKNIEEFLEKYTADESYYLELE